MKRSSSKTAARRRKELSQKQKDVLMELFIELTEEAKKLSNKESMSFEQRVFSKLSKLALRYSSSVVENLYQLVKDSPYTLEEIAKMLEIHEQSLIYRLKNSSWNLAEVESFLEKLESREEK